MAHGHIGSMRARDGQRNAVVDILLSGADGPLAGRSGYVIGTVVLPARPVR